MNSVLSSSSRSWGGAVALGEDYEAPGGVQDKGTLKREQHTTAIYPGGVQDKGTLKREQHTTAIYPGGRFCRQLWAGAA